MKVQSVSWSKREGKRRGVRVWTPEHRWTKLPTAQSRPLSTACNFVYIGEIMEALIILYVFVGILLVGVWSHDIAAIDETVIWVTVMVIYMIAWPAVLTYKTGKTLQID